MDDNVIEFPGEYYTRQKRSQEIVENMALNYVNFAEEQGFNVYDAQFIYDMARIKL